VRDVTSDAAPGGGGGRARAVKIALTNSVQFYWMPFQKAYEYRDKAEGFLRMAREATYELTRKFLNDLVAENIAKAEELEALTDHPALRLTLSEGRPQKETDKPCQ
jgi:hypothetical protein